ncbi:beta-lactamase hydrolase domain-containing protein [Idiomarina abyssalis]|uniref:Serine/threonine protein phosphatase n=1 Tax=Idiomarina abyssalis TaxID=86102 RepID=A0A8I1G5E8_9GAMM|nr:sulfur transferase domain-containing protein [Idiomarina abyssalis]MBJ7266114.1 serine/threonine protein phosphatase [Idiomarina abyssalis]MBJ7272829.1 serine/threonine protein phosphatase [Idiomarina abyssalis]MBJ7316253.1 serine/threonine protein phosphatase [Idiomarina abyssalis]
MVKGLIKVLVALSVVIVSFNVSAGIESPKQVSEKLWVMGTPSDEQLAEFADNGGDVVINLLSQKEMTESEEAAVVTRNGMAYYHVPVNGADGVTLENARMVDRILLENSDKTVLVHCASSNRVGALMALRAGWLDGMPVEKALEVGREHGMTSLEDKVKTMLSE